MESINKLFEEQQQKVTNSLSSIYSKEDVLFIIESLRQQTIATKEQTPTFNEEYIVNEVKDLIDNYDFSVYINCEPEIQGGYSGNYSLEMNVDFDSCEFKRDFISELLDFFTPNDNSNESEAS